MTQFRIQKFKVKNFKAFRESSLVDLKPLTVIAGTNSSGKTSFIQGLLLLKQSLERGGFPRLHLTGPSEETYVHFAPFSEAVFKYASDDDAKLGFHVQIQGDMPEDIARKFFRGELPEPVESEEDGELVIEYPLSLYVDILFRYDEKWGAVLDVLDCRTFSDSAIGPRLIVSPDHTGGKDKVEFFSAIEDWEAKWCELIDFNWQSLIPSVLRIAPFEKNEEADTLGATFYRILDELSPIMNPLRWLSIELEDRFHYLESLRPRPRPLYMIDPSPPLTVSAKGELPFQRLWYNQEKAFEAIAPGFGGEEQKLVDAANKILKSLGIEQSLSIHPEGSLGFQIRFSTLGGEESVSIPHVGFGISQILPIILICLESKPGDTIIIDHPEIHLHPNAQALMADYFLELTQHDRRLIVETHSQYFINRLVRRAAEKEGVAENINILFVRPPQGTKGATIAPLEINAEGDISNWPPDFFPEPDDDIAKTLMVKFRRG